MASKDQVTHPDSQKPLSIGVLGIDKGFQNFRYTSEAQKPKALCQTCFSAV
jgi:hypothetical protein